MALLGTDPSSSDVDRLHGRRFRDRRDAGRRLGEELRRLLHEPRRTLVLGLARGGVIVAAEVAHALGADLDVLTVRKLGAPHQPELAVGAVGPGGIHLLDAPLARRLGLQGRRLELLIEAETDELRRHEEVYRAGRGPLDVRGRTVVVVDDGIATGWTALAALRLLARLGPAETILAVPVAPAEAAAAFEGLVDRFICLSTPEYFVAVGAWYQNFRPVTDEEVIAALRTA